MAWRNLFPDPPCPFASDCPYDWLDSRCIGGAAYACAGPVNGGNAGADRGEF